MRNDIEHRGKRGLEKLAILHASAVRSKYEPHVFEERTALVDARERLKHGTHTRR
jgi:hypothetical protein